VLILILATMTFSELSNAFSTVFSHQELIEISFDASFSSPKFSSVNGYSKIGISGCGMTTNIGKPMLPTRIVSVLIPPDGEVKSIDLISSDVDTLKQSCKILPVQHPVADGASELPKFVEPDPAVYESGEAYPGFLFEDAGVQWMQGYKILNIRLFPMQYSPKSGKVIYYKMMKFVVTVASTGVSPSRSTFSDAKAMISKIVVNPEKVDVWVASSAMASSSPSIDYVIITSTLFQDEFQALANWKANKGLSARVYNTTWIYNNYAGVDNPAKIRNFITDMYNNYGTRMVLLGGDYNIVPPRYIYMEDSLSDSREGGGGLARQYKPTDYYYACLDGNWDPDGDGRYLEQTDLNGDGYPENCAEPIPDFCPEVYVGRLPAATEAEAQFLVNRTKNYEESAPLGDWRNKALLLGAISNYENEDRTGWARTDDAKEQEWVKDNLLGPRGYSMTIMYEKQGRDPSTYACTYWLNQSNVQTSLSSGCWLMSTAGHGTVRTQNRKIWASDDGDLVPESSEMTTPPFIDSTSMTLSNGEKLPQVYIDACFNGKFDDTSYNCVAEWLLKLGSGGAIAVTAASRISYYMDGWQKGMAYNQELLCLYWQEFFNTPNGYRPGKALYWSKFDYWQEGFDMTDYASKKDLLIYNLLGDPDLQLATHDVAVVGINPPPPQIPQYSPIRPVTVHLTNQGTVLESFNVTLYWGDMVIGFANVVNLSPGALLEKGFNWYPDTLGTGTIKAVASTVSGETDTADNTYVDGTVTVYAEYSVTIIAHCNTEGQDVSVGLKCSIYPDMLFLTPRTFSWCSGTTTFTVDDFDPSGHLFKQWNTGETNSTITVTSGGTYTAYYEAVRDVTITSVTPFKTVVGQGYSANINVTAENQGDYTETFNVTAYANTTIIATLLTNITLTSGNSTTITFTWNTTGVPYGNYTISAYATPVPGESYTADNTYPDGWVVVTIPGDVEGSGYVDWTDLGMLGIAYETGPGNPYWNPNADINSSGRVTWEDLGTLGLNYETGY